jgi:hypothetical protein
MTGARGLFAEALNLLARRKSRLPDGDRHAGWASRGVRPLGCRQIRR